MKTMEAKESNLLRAEDSPVHAWYRFVLSYPPHLVRKYADEFNLKSRDVLLDPFCGTGTTLVEAKKQGIPSIGMEAHPFAAMVSRVKTNWNLVPAELNKLAVKICRSAEDACSEHELHPISFDSRLIQEIPSLNGYSLTEDEEKMIPTGFLSQRPQGRLLILRHWIEKWSRNHPVEVREFFYIAMASVISNGAGNFAFGPEIYRTKPKEDYDVIGHFARHVSCMINDLSQVVEEFGNDAPSHVVLSDARSMGRLPRKATAVITSPPYPNEKDYTRTTRVESVLLRFFQDREDIRGVKEHLLRSNTRNVFVRDKDGDDVSGFDSIRKVCAEIENRRIELKKTSGFERLYHKVVAHYFGGMRRHFRVMKKHLRPGSPLAYVVGDQYSFLMVPVRTAQLLAEVAESEGYIVEGVDLWRERVGTKVRNSRDNAKTIRVREEVLKLRVPK